MHSKLFIAISYENNRTIQHLQQIIFQHMEPMLKEYNGVIRMQKHLHLTLYFLGYKPNSEILSIIKKCQHAIDLHKQLYNAHSLAHYSSKVSFDIIGNEVIALMLEPSAALSNLYYQFTKQFEQNGTQNSRSFLPHITLVRIKKIHQKDFASLKIAFSMVFAMIAQKFPDHINVGFQELILFSSDQGTYKEIAKSAV
jgi:2'-5' RNA ligase